jgi:hypothetical protein
VTRLDRAILWLADRVPLSLALGGPMGFAWGFVGSFLLPRAGGMHWVPFVIMLVTGFGLGAAGGRWQTHWMHRKGIDRCTACFRPGRWAIRITCTPDDSLAIPESPPWCHFGCWCRRHATAHLSRMFFPRAHECYSEVSLVPYDRNWGRHLLNEERERRLS